MFLSINKYNSFASLEELFNSYNFGDICNVPLFIFISLIQIVDSAHLPVHTPTIQRKEYHGSTLFPSKVLDLIISLVVSCQNGNKLVLLLLSWHLPKYFAVTFIKPPIEFKN